MPTKKETTAAAKAIKDAAAPGPVANCVWSNNNSACTNTWFCLSKDIMGQHDVDFDTAETLKMSELAFWSDLAEDTRKVEARAIADMLTKLFVNMVGAEYEDGHNYASAVEAMGTILADEDKTMCELAAVVDEQHHFLTE
jgi:hypothetical protein